LADPASKWGGGGARNRGQEIARVCTIHQTSRGTLIKKYIIKNKKKKGEKKLPKIASITILLAPSEWMPIAVKFTSLRVRNILVSIWFLEKISKKEELMYKWDFRNRANQ
jgi:hypothetical protein